MKMFLIILFALPVLFLSCSTTKETIETVCTVSNDICIYASDLCLDKNEAEFQTLVVIAQQLKKLAGLDENPVFNSICDVSNTICTYTKLICRQYITQESLSKTKTESVEKINLLDELKSIRERLKQ